MMAAYLVDSMEYWSACARVAMTELNSVDLMALKLVVKLAE